MTDVMLKVDSDSTRLVVDSPPQVFPIAEGQQARAIVFGNDSLIAVDVPYGGLVFDSVSSVAVVQGGQQGLKGDKGDQGPAGSDKAYTHHQQVASAMWTIAHGLGKFPAVTVVDTAGSRVYGEETYPDQDTVVLNFTSAFSGLAYCN